MVCTKLFLESGELFLRQGIVVLFQKQVFQLEFVSGTYDLVIILKQTCASVVYDHWVFILAVAQCWGERLLWNMWNLLPSRGTIGKLQSLSSVGLNVIRNSVVEGFGHLILEIINSLRELPIGQVRPLRRVEYLIGPVGDSSFFELDLAEGSGVKNLLYHFFLPLVDLVCQIQLVSEYVHGLHLFVLFYTCMVPNWLISGKRRSEFSRFPIRQVHEFLTIMVALGILHIFDLLWVFWTQINF